MIAAFLITALLCAGPAVRCSAATWHCRTALDILGAEKSGGVFAGGWRLQSAACSETGVYYYQFSHPQHETLTLALNLAAITPRDFRGGKRHLIYLQQSGGAQGTPPGVLALRDEISERTDKWEARVKRADTAAGAAVLGLAFLSLIWISFIAKSVRAGRAGLIWNAQLFLASLLLALTAVELGFRGFNISYKDSGMMSFMADVRDQAVLHGGFRRLEKSAPDAADSDKAFNSLGFRDAGHEVKNEVENRTNSAARGAHANDGTIRIACAGDSFMFGIGVGSDATFPAALERVLSAKAPARHVQTLNFGFPGSAAADISSILLTEAAASQPDLVIYGYVLNDIDLGSFLDVRTYFDGIGIKPGNLERTIRRHDLGGLRRYLRTYHYFIARYEDRLLNKLILDMYSKSYEPRRNPGGLKRLNKDFQLIHEYYSARGVPVVLMIYPILTHLDKSYPFAPTHERVAAMARRNGMSVIDLLPFYKGNKPETLWASRTDHHPNRLGHQIAADAAADFMIKNNLIKPAPQRPDPRAPAQTIEGAEAAAARAEAALRANHPDAALQLIAPAMVQKPGSCRLQELAARILLARNAQRAVSQKIQRMKSISPACAAKAKKIQSLAEKQNSGAFIH